MDYLLLDITYSDSSAIPRLSYNHSVVLPFEEVLDKEYWKYHWMTKWHWSIPISLFYLLVVNLIRVAMRNREALKIRGILVFWNTALAIFSIVGAVRTWEEWLHALSHHGLYSSICRSYDEDGVCAHWYFYFTISKVFEFGDTVLLALRKRPLSFLHCYHHMSVLVISVQSGAEQVSAGRWFISMNFGAHAVMYTYFSLVSCGVRVPKKIAACVTTIQITQLLLGAAVNVAVVFVKTFTEWECNQSWMNIGICFFVYVTYSMLFIQFFHNAYVKKKEKKKRLDIVV